MFSYYYAICVPELLDFGKFAKRIGTRSVRGVQNELCGKGLARFLRTLSL